MEKPVIHFENLYNLTVKETLVQPSLSLTDSEISFF